MYNTQKMQPATLLKKSISDVYLCYIDNFIMNYNVLLFSFLLLQVWFGFMVFNASFNNISVISWRSVLLVEETEYHRHVTRNWRTLSHNVASSTPRHERGSKLLQEGKGCTYCFQFFSI